MRRHLLMTLAAVAVTAPICMPVVNAQAPAGAADKPATIAILECVVYPEGHLAQAVDCARQARSKCDGSVTCELPIGLGLTDGRQIDSDARTWKKVRVRYRCGNTNKVDGPYIQEESATMLLGCGGGS